ncbi:unnamed protein product [marine sediment metagenome]|uniref:Uncharacterized protein n=1 Tax=marine sediment metagenome TaxID=412755 RepID=X1T6K6_9ZZZZ
MNQAEFIEEKRKVWAEQERRYGMLFDGDFREAVEARAGITLAFGDPSAGLEDLRASIPEFVEPALILLNNSTGTSAPKKVKPEKRRRKHFERRFYLVRFVIDCWERDGRSYIPWEYVTTEWNKAHPSDQINKAVLKAEFYRAFKEKDLIFQLFLVKVWRNLDTFKLFLLRLEKNYKVNAVTLAKFYRAWLHLIVKEDAEPMDEWLAEVEEILKKGGKSK